MKAVIYARYSSSLQSFDSIEAQLFACKEYCQKKKYFIAGTYIDEAVSARTSNRPQFQKMLADAKTGNFDVLIVHKVDRFARNLNDAILSKYTLQMAGVSIEYTELPIDDSPESIILEAMMHGYAEYYSRNLAKETMKGLLNNARKGKFNGGFAPFGYKIVDGNYEIDQVEAEGVKLIFKMYLDGCGYKEILDALNAKNFKSRFNKPISKNSLHDILSNPRYCGTYVFNKVKKRPNGSRNTHSTSNETIILPNAVPAIISPELFAETKKMMEKNRKHAGSYLAKATYLLSGKIQCGVCGAAMIGKTSTVNGKTYQRYYCGNQDRHIGQCTNTTIVLSDLEDFVIHEIEQRFFSNDSIRPLTDAVARAYKEKSSSTRAEISSLEKQLADTKKKIAHVITFIENGNASPTLAEKLSENEANLHKLSINLESAKQRERENIPSAQAIREMIQNFRQEIKTKNPDNVRVLLNTFLDHVVVNAENIDVYLRMRVGAIGAEGSKQCKYRKLYSVIFYGFIE